MNRRLLIKQAIVVLNFPKVINKLILLAKAIASAMQSTPTFAALAPKLAELVAHIIKLEGIIESLNERDPLVSLEMREAAASLVKDDLRTLRMDVQMIADKDPENAVAIIISSGMKVKLIAARGRKQNTVSDGREEGSVNLSSATTGPHDWRMSADGIKFSYLPSSNDSKTLVFNLIPGAIYYFQNRQSLPYNEKGEWSPVIKFRVR